MGRGGHESRDLGAQLEGKVKRKLDALEQLAIVKHYQKNAPAFALVGNKPKRHVCPVCGTQGEERFEPCYKRVEASGADFSGHLGERTSRPGLAFGVEVKSVGPKPPKQGAGMQSFIREARMPDEQIYHLDMLAAVGAISLILLEWRCVDEPWWISIIPWTNVPWRRAKVRSHIDMEAARPWRTLPDRGLASYFFVDGTASASTKTS